MSFFTEKLADAMTILDAAEQHRLDETVARQPFHPEWVNMPKTVDTLNIINFPLRHGWTIAEAVEILRPQVSRMAARFVTSRFHMGKAICVGDLAVLDALETESHDPLTPFLPYANATIMNRIRKAAKHE
jgi:hypothetical protein